MFDFQGGASVALTLSRRVKNARGYVRLMGGAVKNPVSIGTNNLKI